MKSDTLKIHIIKEEYRKADSNPPFNIHAIKVFLDATEDWITSFNVDSLLQSNIVFQPGPSESDF